MGWRIVGALLTSDWRVVGYIIDGPALIDLESLTDAWTIHGYYRLYN